MFYCAISPTEISWLLFQLVYYEAQGVGAAATAQFCHERMKHADGALRASLDLVRPCRLFLGRTLSQRL